METSLEEMRLIFDKTLKLNDKMETTFDLYEKIEQKYYESSNISSCVNSTKKIKPNNNI